MCRYTEFKLATLAAEDDEPGAAFRALQDFAPYAAVADLLLSEILRELSALRLEDKKRVTFYALGAGEGLLLDKVNLAWQGRYFADKFYLEKYFGSAK